MNNNPPDFLKEGVHVQMLINRGVGNSHKSSKRWVNKLISKNVQQYNKNIEILIDQQNHVHNADIRLYACINPRNMNEAIKLFKHKQIDAMYKPFLEDWYFHIDVKNQFISCLMKPESRIRKYYLIDLDTKEPGILGQTNDYCYSENITVAHKYETPNGYHYICEPFNVEAMQVFLNPPSEVKKDGLMLINSLDWNSK